jgi:transcriptional regulator with XRE-family HTH domain
MGTSKLKVILAERDISIKELAAATGLHPDTLGRIANGRKPNIDSAYTIAEALGMHINKVFPNHYEYSSLKRLMNSRRSSGIK